MEKENIPKELIHLIPFVEKWGISDDGFRDELVYNSSRADLEALVYSINSLSKYDLDIFANWLCNPTLGLNPNEEYIMYSSYFMAFEYAKSRLTYEWS